MSIFDGAPTQLSDSKPLLSKATIISTLQKKPETVSEIASGKSHRSGRRSTLPPVPKFEGPGSGKHSDDDQHPEDDNKKKKMEIEAFKFLNEVKSEDSSSKKSTSNQFIGPIVPARSESPMNIESTDMKASTEQTSTTKKAEATNPQKPKIDEKKLAYLQNLYASKQQKPENQPKAEELKAKTTVQAITVTDNAPVQLQRAREEYDPGRPNDYEIVMAERSRKQREEELTQQAKLEKERKLKAQEAAKNDENSFAMSDAGKQAKKDIDIDNDKIINIEEKSQEEKIISMLEKTGWKMGQGLGKHGQGMTTPLIAKKTTSNTAVIVNSSVDMTAVMPAEIVWKKQLEQSYNMPPTRILVLLNMVSPKEIDDTLRDEVIDECKNYGKVLNCIVHQLSGVPEDQAVRIFVEYDKKESAALAFSHLHMRFFGGRQTTAKFYDEKSYGASKLELPI